MMRSILMIALAAGLAVSLGACGRKGMPDAPEDAVYPRVYPYTPQPGQARTGKDEDPDFQAPKPRPPAAAPDLNFHNGY